MTFLLPYVKGNDKTTSKITPSEEVVPTAIPAVLEDNEELKVLTENLEVVLDSNDINDTSTSRTSSTVERQKRQTRVSKRKNFGKALANASQNLPTLMQESIAIQTENQTLDDSDKFGNKSFLLSFVPIMDRLPLRTALDVRMKITQAFTNATHPHSEESEPK